MGYIEDTREPEERTKIATCIESGDPLYPGDEVLDVPSGYISSKHRTKAALKYASREELIEYITSNNLEDKFGIWFYEPYVKILEAE